ncbi:tRNAHis guanylyltransferase [Methanobrevibacter cuticularis]|uniref:tRNAHis guanylyltransferase n=1 Tax=Methanobrevibacter cuticularis TaxID=47311 RepID=A0A166E4Q1_9EURY|nr:tRNA(His) guanylyltransferase Thg1 family protein [Methanobrevibacter cuticularis]KZX16276.1 tRNAHis guanylyltransferase [Methanobrevibacter cuticularis]
MKDYEIYNDLKVPKGSKIILRLDGRNFSNLSKSLNFKKPYDDNFSTGMVEAARNLFKEFSPSFIYTFSDEINILLSEIPFSGRIEKLNSVFPSIVASSLTLHLTKFFNLSLKKNRPISFDSRIIPITNNDIYTYFKHRQDESWRNCINGYGIWTLKKEFSTKVASEKLKNLKSSDIHQLLFEKGINLNDIPSYKKRGIAIYKKTREINGFNPKINEKTTSHRNVLFVDRELPIFSYEFFEKNHIQ